MHTDSITAIQQLLGNTYAPAEYPALQAQMTAWSTSRPLAGLRLLDATPLFRNTLLKDLALLSAGADLTVATSDAIPFDHAIADSLRNLGLPHVHNCRTRGSFDIILDCGGIHAALQPTIGFVELTRSGASRFQNADRPVILVDDTRTKTIETGLGTGDGFRRAMTQLGHGDFLGRRLVIFGCGKVGRGIAFHARRFGAEVIGVDDPERFPPIPDVTFIDRHDLQAVTAAVRTAWCVVSATGHANALQISELTSELLNGSQLIANMGVEDEWGTAIPPERALNRKQPLNFILDEPTQLRYIDPTMALSNASALELALRPGTNGLRRPPAELETAIWQQVAQHGLIADEIANAVL